MKSKFRQTGKYGILIVVGMMAVVSANPVWSDGLNANTGISNGSTIGNDNTTMEDMGVGVNGNVNDSNINNNQNNLSTGNNTNVNALSPVLVAPSSSNGGSSAIVLPRNPLPMTNAALGRSNFGLQVGVNNNPTISGLSGGDAALGWFMQAGLNIPFGKIPDVYKNPASAKMDDMRLDTMARQRDVFGSVQTRPAAQSDVMGKVVGLSAYNYSATPSAKLNLQEGLATQAASIGEIQLPQPRVLALDPSEVFNRPLNTGEKIGLVEVGREYPYLGHTRTGWVKILLPDGSEGWTSTNFEYIKFDYTEVDNLATVETGKKTALNTPSEETVKKNKS